MSWPRILLCGIAAAAAVSVIHTLLAESRSGPNQAEITIGRLQAKLAELEERVKALEDHKLSFSPIVPAAGETPPATGRTFPPHNDSDPIYDPSRGLVPPTWNRGEINGLRFYTIPVRATAPRSTPTRE